MSHSSNPLEDWATGSDKPAAEKPLLSPLLDYSKQILQVGTPPRLVFDSDGHVVDRDLVALSVQMRIAEALEQQSKKDTKAAKRVRVIAAGMRRNANYALDLWEGENGPLSEEDQLEVRRLLQEISDTTWPIPGFASKKSGSHGLKITLTPPRHEEKQFSDFLMREASGSTFNQEDNQWTIPVHSAPELFHLGADWRIYKSQGYTFSPGARKIDKDLSLTADQAAYFRIFVANWNTDGEGNPETPTVEILYEEEYNGRVTLSLSFLSIGWAFDFAAKWAVALKESIQPIIDQGLKPLEEGEVSNG